MKDPLVTISKKESRWTRGFKASPLLQQFSPTEKVVFTLLGVIFTASVLWMLQAVNEHFLVKVPAQGGSLEEGIVGTPRFINPLLAMTDADRDMTTLVYSGLLKAQGPGELIPDLAESYSISKDGLIYSFKLKDKIFFHDNTPVTAEDVEFTLKRAQDAGLKSPKRANWEGVSIEKVDEKNIRFILKKPYSPFLENATLGILPKHIWKNVDAEAFTFSLYNTEPIGSGPYKITGIERDSGGLPELYELESFSAYALGKPHISEIFIKIYPNEKALLTAYKNKDVESINGITPVEAETLKKAGTHLERSPLPRIFALFFNQNNAPVLANQEVRTALNLAIDRERIVDEVLGGYGIPITSPIPPGNIGLTPLKVDEFGTRVAEAQKLLDKNGWKMNQAGVLEKKTKKETQTLAFTISTTNAPELRRTAELLKGYWEHIGAKITVKVFETSELNQNILRPRKYDALLFGEIIGRDLDLFAFWHSSQRNDPGLNIALYVNSKADKLLDEARTISDKVERIERYSAFNEIITKEIPAIFIYSPDFIYVIPPRIQGFKLGQITTPSDRFAHIHEWHIATDKVWKIFVNK